MVNAGLSIGHPTSQTQTALGDALNDSRTLVPETPEVAASCIFQDLPHKAPEVMESACMNCCPDAVPFPKEHACRILCGRWLAGSLSPVLTGSGARPSSVDTTDEGKTTKALKFRVICLCALWQDSIMVCHSLSCGLSSQARHCQPSMKLS